jgi:pimeloyl-ACP methyl ester carboxylesterase
MLSSRTIAANGIDIFLTEEGSGPLVLLCHGWPELSYSWRHQLPALAAAGFHVVAPDMRGFGRTSAPLDINAYSIFDIVGDMVALVAALGQQKAIIIGHDWGAPVAWHAAMFRPDIFKAVGGLSVAPPWRGRERPLAALAKSGVTNFYWQYFQAPGVAEAELDRDTDYTLRSISFDSNASLFLQEGFGFLGDPATPRKLAPWSSKIDHAHVVENYTRSGFRGGLNWYRNLDRNWDLTAPWQGAQIHQPSIFIAGAKDAVVTGIIGGKRVTEMDRVLPNLKRKLIIEGAGHWIQQERPDEVNAALIEFLESVRD